MKLAYTSGGKPMFLPPSASYVKELEKMPYSCFPSWILDPTYVFFVFATDVTFGQLFPLFIWFLGGMSERL